MTWPKRIEAPCSISGCGKPFKARGLCGSHYKLWRLNGDPLIMKRAANGEGHKEKSGYIQFRAANGRQGKRQHVLVAEKALGRELPNGARVHHANGIKSDNRPDNLVICPDEAYHMLLHKRIREYDRRNRGLEI